MYWEEIYLIPVLPELSTLSDASCSMVGTTNPSSINASISISLYGKKNNEGPYLCYLNYVILVEYNLMQFVDLTITAIPINVLTDLDSSAKCLIWARIQLMSAEGAGHKLFGLSSSRNPSNVYTTKEHSNDDQAHNSCSGTECIDHRIEKRSIVYDCFEPYCVTTETHTCHLFIVPTLPLNTT